MKELKNILVATDFSKGSYNAFEYALEIAKICDANVFLLHAYRLIPSTSEKQDAQIFKKNLESAIQQEFKKMRNHLLYETEENNQVNCISQVGFPESVIESFINAESIDLIVMGTSGLSNSSKAFGSTLSAVTANTHLPILAIPETVSFKKWKRILLTQKNTSSSKMIPYLINKFHSEFALTNIDDSEFNTFISKSIVANSDDILSIRPKEYTRLEKKLLKRPKPNLRKDS